MPVPAESSDPRLAVNYNQLQWLSAIEGKGSDEADRWYRELSADPAIGSLLPHPDFHSFTQVSYGTGPTPYSTEELVAFAGTGSLVEKLNAFTETNPWDGPTEASLVETLVGAVSADPEPFLHGLPTFLNARRPYQYGIIAGFKKLWDATGEATTSIDWNDAWLRLIGFFESLIGNDAFWIESDGNRSYRDWISAVIAEFLRAGTRKDEKAYDPALLRRTWPLVQILVERSPEKTELDKSDPMNRAINSPKGKAIEALVDHALRVCRINDKETGSHTAAWSQMKPVFDAESAKCRNTNFEFSTLAGAYIAHMHYIDRQWCEENLERIFPLDSPTNCRCALDGFTLRHRLCRSTNCSLLRGSSSGRCVMSRRKAGHAHTCFSYWP